jgi:hypothetical protein
MKKPLGKVAFGLGIKLVVYFFLSAFLFDANTLVSAGAGTAAALAAACRASTIGVTSVISFSCDSCANVYVPV